MCLDIQANLYTTKLWGPQTTQLLGTQNQGSRQPLPLLPRHSQSGTLGWVIWSTPWWWFNSTAIPKMLLFYLESMAGYLQMLLKQDSCELVPNQWHTWNGLTVMFVHTLQVRKVLLHLCCYSNRDMVQLQWSILSVLFDTGITVTSVHALIGEVLHSWKQK